MHLRDGLGYSEIARRTGLSRNTIKRWLKGATAGAVKVRRYRRRAVARKLAKYIEQIERALVADSTRVKRDRRTGKQIFAEIKAAGYTGGYSVVTDFIRAWQCGHGNKAPAALKRLSRQLLRRDGGARIMAQVWPSYHGQVWRPS